MTTAFLVLPSCPRRLRRAAGRATPGTVCTLAGTAASPAPPARLSAHPARAPQVRMMPAQILPARVAMGADRHAHRPRVRQQRRMAHGLEIGVGIARPAPRAAPPPAPGAGSRGPSPPSPAAPRRSSRSGSRRRSRAGRGYGPWRGPPRSRPPPRRRRARRNPPRTRPAAALSAETNLQCGEPAHRSSRARGQRLGRGRVTASPGRLRTHPTISAVSTTAWKSTFAPFSAQSGVISSASLC